MDLQSFASFVQMPTYKLANRFLDEYRSLSRSKAQEQTNFLSAIAYD